MVKIILEASTMASLTAPLLLQDINPHEQINEQIHIPLSHGGEHEPEGRYLSISGEKPMFALEWSSHI